MIVRETSPTAGHAPAPNAAETAPVKRRATPRFTAATRRRTTPKITADERARMRAEAVQLYQAGSSIRQVARRLDRSYGLIYTLLHEADVELRQRGREPSEPETPAPHPS